MKKKAIALMVAVSLCLTNMIPVAETWAESVEEPPVSYAEEEKQEPSGPVDEPEKEKTVEESSDESSQVEEPVDEEKTNVAEEPVEEQTSGEETVKEEAGEEAGEPVKEQTSDEEAAEEQGDKEAEAHDEEKSEEKSEEQPEETVKPVPDMAIALGNVSLYAVKGGAAHATLTVTGGCAPYTVAYGGQTIEMESEGENVLWFTAENGGEQTLTVEVTDADGNVCKKSVVVPVSVNEKGDADEYLKKAEALKKELTGEWHEDILMMARSQIGYRESSKNFVIPDLETGKQGYTLYGDMAGLPYLEWCAMFVGSVAKFAEIPGWAFPVFSNQNRWIESLKKNGAYEDDKDEYKPVPGDLIFFSWEGDKNDADHIGIVEDVDSEYVYTIEGNLYGSVRRNSHELSDKCVIGYGNLWQMMDNAGIVISEYEAVENATGMVYSNTNLRERETVYSTVLALIEPEEELKVLGRAVCINGETWINVQFGEDVGYIRGDLIAVTETAAEESDKQTICTGRRARTFCAATFL